MSHGDGPLPTGDDGPRLSRGPPAVFFPAAQSINRPSTNIMKTKSNHIRILFATVTLGALASFAYAGPPSQFWNRARPVTTFSEAKKVGPDDTVTMQCKSCKTVLIRNSKHVGPQGKGHEEWFTVGSKHKCTECDGEITVVAGKTKDSMQHNCSKCGEGAVSCCATTPDKS